MERNYAWSNDTRLWRAALQVCPRSAKVLYTYAGTLVTARQYQQALPYLQRSLQIDPEEHVIHMMLAKCHRELGEKNPALTHATRALMLQPTLSRVQQFTREIVAHYQPELDEHWRTAEFGVPNLARVLMSVGELLLNPEFVSTAISLDPSLAGHFYTEQFFKAIDLAVTDVPPIPKTWVAQRGIVVCAGRLSYLTAAYVTLHLLRETGCKLPVELWYNGAAELPPGASAWFAGLGDLRLVDASKLLVDSRQNLSGYQIKPFAISQSGFREVMLLDADNAPIQDPSKLFDDPHYVNTGALFWPDYCGVQSISAELWQLMGLEPPLAEAEFPDPPFWKKGGCSDQRYDNEFESGQLIIDKVRHWPSLQGALYMNIHHSYFYSHMHGDKDTFRLAWNAARAPFHLVQYPFTVYGQVLPAKSGRKKDSSAPRMCGVGVWGQRHPSTGEVVFVHNYKWHPAQLVQEGYSQLLQVAADYYDSLSWEKGCGPLAVTLFYAPQGPQVRALHDKEARFEKRGRELLRRLWDTPSYQNYFCSNNPKECASITRGLNARGG